MTNLFFFGTSTFLYVLILGMHKHLFVQSKLKRSTFIINIIMLSVLYVAGAYITIHQLFPNGVG